ncbi:uncharacterized protein BDW70DRAFT_116794 [Aspergillus foveolatus]|uniref:uncharacterized protein n=1 Tax=Aspergillus foveolatus TaxID=210207 RepID=UPI003CCD947B
MRRKSVKPSEYPALPFHLIRFILFLSSLLVAIILAVFAYKLHQADQKFPWAFLVLIIAAFLSLLNLIFTTILHCCYGLSPRLSLITNSIVFVIWAVAFVLLAWAVSHTILTTCNATYWATTTGIAVCRMFKALFSFTIIGAAALIASIVLDVIAYRRQTRLGEYDPMALGMEGHSLAEYKPGAHNRDSSALSGSFPHPAIGASPGIVEDDRAPLVSGGRYDGPGHLRGRSEEMDIGESRPLHQPPPYASNPVLERYSDGPQHPHSGMRMSAYDNPYGYGQQTSYDPTAYR